MGTGDESDRTMGPRGSGRETGRGRAVVGDGVGSVSNDIYHIKHER